MVIGPRKTYKKEPPASPYSIPYVLLGLALLWMGWFGFNGGSALAANMQAIQAMVNTHLAACAAGLTWMFIGWKQTGKASVIGFASGALAGLVAITPAAGYVPVWSSLVIGVVVGFLCYTTLWFRNNRMNVDESLDAWAVHGCGGIWGCIATGIFAGAFGYFGLLTGSPGQLLFQLIDASVVLAYAFTVTYVLAWVIHHTMGLRVKEEEEYVGLDISQHGETL
jgi:Amt family ammonium transporter